jgi:uncharacterized protein DUF6429
MRGADTPATAAHCSAIVHPIQHADSGIWQEPGRRARKKSPEIAWSERPPIGIPPSVHSTANGILCCQSSGNGGDSATFAAAARLHGDAMPTELDTDKIDETVLALLYLTLHDGFRAWKGFDWNALNRLHDKGMISNPVGKAKSVVLTEEGLRESERLFKHMFTKR